MSQNQQQLPEIDPPGKMDIPGHRLSPTYETEPGQLVPVSEAIKYRKRAQAAEQQVEELTQYLKAIEQEKKEAQTHMSQMVMEKEITRQLVRAGAIDLEAGLLLVQSKIAKSDGEHLKKNIGEDEIKGMVETLRNERSYLFHGAISEVSAGLGSSTATVRAHGRGGVNALTRLAQQAQHSGSRKDIQEYMRLRRSVSR